MAFGVVPEGFAIKDRETIIDEMEKKERSDIDAGFNTQADSLAGQFNGVVGDQVAELWEVLGAVYRARQPDSANDEALDNVSAITGTKRLSAAPSTAIANLNLDPAVTVTIGSIVGIGLSGAQWETLAAITNGGGDQATVSVAVESSDDAPIVGNANSIDTIVTPIGGWSAKAAFTGLTTEPFVLEDLQTLLVQVDEGATQTVVFNTADFVSIAAATAQEVIDAIVADTTGIDGLDVSGIIRLFSDLDGTGSAIKVLGGTGFEPLGLSAELIKGFNPNRAAKIVNANSETYDMSGAPDLLVAVDGGSPQTITFADSDFGVAAIGTITPVAASLLVVGADTDTFTLDDSSNPAVVFAFDDDSSVVETSTLRAINHNGTQTASQIRDLAVAAINSAPTLDITARPSTEDSDVWLVHDVTGVVGSIIFETVADAGFLVTGMAGGVANAPTVATAAQVARKISSSLTGGIAYDVSGKVQIESDTVGINSALEVTGGTSNTELGYTLSSIEVGIAGDAVVGRDEEEDEDFRLRRVQLLRSSGASTVEAIRAGLLDPVITPGVEQAFVFENDTDVTDGDGRPPHSFEAVVFGGTDQDIAQTLFDLKPIGIQTFKVAGPNGVTVVIVDSQGTNHTINFSRADVITEHTIIDVSVVAAEFGGGDQVAGEAQIRDAIKALGDTLDVGEDVIILRFKCVPFTIAGVVDVTDIFIEDVDPPTDQINIVITQRELATFITANIDINVVFV